MCAADNSTKEVWSWQAIPKSQELGTGGVFGLVTDVPSDPFEQL